jgi:hypothetical protein
MLWKLDVAFLFAFVTKAVADAKAKVVQFVNSQVGFRVQWFRELA